MDYIPAKESDKVDFFDNMLQKADAEGAVLGLSAADITDIKTACTNSKAAIKNYSDGATTLQKLKAAKDTQLKTDAKNIRAIVKKMKSSTAYTEAIGKNLHIIGEDPTIDYSSYKPSIKATVMPGRVRIDFIKGGLDGLHIYTRLKGQASWTKLALDTYSPYEDNRPLTTIGQPEHREYMAIGVLHDEEITQQSDIIEAVFGG